MPRRQREQLRALVCEVARRFPAVHDPRGAIVAGEVTVDGFVRTNPASLIRVNASIRLRENPTLRGTRKLRAALAAFGVDARGVIALDVGAAAGGFTQALLEAGARRVYAVDAGHGQLRGFLRQDARVVNLESTNLGELDRGIVRDAIGVVSIDLSYLALRVAVPQLKPLVFQPGADAIALVKPQFELGLPRPPETPAQLERAVGGAVHAFRSNGWRVDGVIESPVRGAGGSVEFLLHARWAG